jgi:chromosome segregation ATPase
MAFNEAASWNDLAVLKEISAEFGVALSALAALAGRTEAARQRQDKAEQRLAGHLAALAAWKDRAEAAERALERLSALLAEAATWLEEKRPGGSVVAAKYRSELVDLAIRERV